MDSIRILPHYQDTGGFFVAVLEKLEPLPWEAQTGASRTAQQGDGENATSTEDTVQFDHKRPKKRIKLGYKEDPFVFFGPDEEVWSSVR